MQIRTLALVAALAATAAGCAPTSVSNKQDPLGSDIIEEANLADLLLAAGDPSDAVLYFEQAVERTPENPNARRGLAKAYAKAKRYPEAARVYQELVTAGQAEPADRLEYAYVAIRLEDWESAESLAAGLPQAMNTPRRHLLDAILADHRQDWAAADAAYERAERLSPTPAEVLNNWGVSRMSRGDLEAAEDTFRRAVSYDSRLFEAKNNLAISRGLRGDYEIPVVPLTDVERARILNNLGLIALRRGDRLQARGLFAEAVATHPQHYEAAAARLATLESSVLE